MFRKLTNIEVDTEAQKFEYEWVEVEELAHGDVYAVDNPYTIKVESGEEKLIKYKRKREDADDNGNVYDDVELDEFDVRFKFVNMSKFMAQTEMETEMTDEVKTQDVVTRTGEIKTEKYRKREVFINRPIDDEPQKVEI